MECHTSTWQEKFSSELRAASALFEAGYSIDCLLIRCVHIWVGGGRGVAVGAEEGGHPVLAVLCLRCLNPFGLFCVANKVDLIASDQLNSTATH